MGVSTYFHETSAVITLNRPEKLNATNLETIQQIAAVLDKCATTDHIKKIIITSNHPKAFCAGGDIGAIYHLIKEKNIDEAIDFFETEYNLIYALATHPKPIISLVNGLCLGGGMGLSMHNKIRIVTENARLGMPETIIGFFPDVGASFRFAKFPRAWSNFYGLTGYAIPIQHALSWDMADCFVPSANLPGLLERVCQDCDPQTVVKEFSQEVPCAPIFGQDWVEQIFASPLPLIFSRLKDHPHPEAQQTYQDLLKRSHLSLRVTFFLLEEAASFDLKRSLEVDKILALRFLKEPDVIEGIRAQIIDKDKNPKWRYNFDNIADEIEGFLSF